ncbi:MAG: C4-dicarboxylate TRAP transporter substrate-binding protein [Mangrovicoccus sp.]|nr:C4-dicarboxylate TRAP transporter substrate-binding protein [Mangrovicoccus sp.]
MKPFLKSLTIAAVATGFAAEAGATDWNVSLWGKRRAFTEHVEKLAELVSEKTGGEFTLSISYGGLSKNRENLDGISIGAFEMAQFCAGYHRDKNPTITVLELPFLGVETLEEEVAVSHAVYGHPAVAEDLGRWNAKLLMTSPMPQYNIAGAGDPRASLAEFDGMRVRATGGIGAAFEAVGAVPTSMTATEVYNAMESGVIDTAAFAQHAHLSFRTIDIATWWTENLNPGTVNCPVVVNIDAYDALPEAHRAALDESVDEAIAHYLENYGALIEKWEGILTERGVEKVTLPEAELEKFREIAATPITAQWIADMDAQGLPGQELYDLVQSTLAETRASN